MSKCKECKNKNKSTHICDECIDGEMFERKITTQADKIRFMNDEELASYFLSNTGCSCCEKITNGCGLKKDISCRNWMMQWLQSEVEYGN